MSLNRLDIVIIVSRVSTTTQTDRHFVYVTLNAVRIADTEQSMSDEPLQKLILFTCHSLIRSIGFAAECDEIITERRDDRGKRITKIKKNHSENDLLIRLKVA